LYIVGNHGLSLSLVDRWGVVQAGVQHPNLDYCKVVRGPAVTYVSTGLARSIHTLANDLALVDSLVIWAAQEERGVPVSVRAIAVGPGGNLYADVWRGREHMLMVTPSGGRVAALWLEADDIAVSDLCVTPAGGVYVLITAGRLKRFSMVR
jgi:hypothetical protein